MFGPATILPTREKILWKRAEKTFFSLARDGQRDWSHLKILLCDLVMHIADHNPSVVLVVTLAAPEQLNASTTRSSVRAGRGRVKVVRPGIVRRARRRALMMRGAGSKQNRVVKRRMALARAACATRQAEEIEAFEARR